MSDRKSSDQRSPGLNAAGIGVRDGDGVEARLTGLFKKTDRQNDAEFPRQIGEARDHRMAFERRGAGEIVRVFVLAEIPPGEELLQQDHMRALARRAAHQRLRLVEIRRLVRAAGHLRRGDRHCPGH